jgi:hypothetical protein
MCLYNLNKHKINYHENTIGIIDSIFKYVDCIKVTDYAIFLLYQSWQWSAISLCSLQLSI